MDDRSDSSPTPPPDPGSEAVVLETMRMHAQRPWPEMGEVDGAALWRRVEAQIHSDATRSVDGKRAGWGNYSLRPLIWSAALAGAAAVFLFTRPRTSIEPAPLRTYTTTAAQQANVMLDDGTRVMLAPNSRLRVVKFGAQSRTVDVDGEAYFDVAPSNRAPFVVQGGHVAVRVLGTAFLVRHDAGTRGARVSVADGKVRVASRDYPERGVTLFAGQIAEVTDSTAKVSAVSDVAPGTEWLHGQLVFRDMPLVAVLETLSRWYGYQFHCTDAELPRRVVTIGINMQSSADALAALEQILSVNFAVVGDTITLTPQSTKPAKGPARIRTYDSWTPTREVGR